MHNSLSVKIEKIVEKLRKGTNLAGTEIGTLGAAVGASGRLTEEGCCPLLLLLVDRLVELLLLLEVLEGTLVEPADGPELFGRRALDVVEVLAGVGAGGEVLFGAGTLVEGAELLLEGA